MRTQLSSLREAAHTLNDKRLPLRDAVRTHAGRVSLDEKQLARLGFVQGDMRGAFEVPEKPNRWRFAALAVVLLAGVLSGFGVAKFGYDGLLASRIIEETVHNHVAHMPLEVRGRQVKDLAPYFTGLGFEPQADEPQMAQAELLGGRYCSIQGKRAAQLRYAASKNSYETVFQVPMISNLKADLPLHTHRDGYAVTMWRDQGLLKVHVSGTF